MTRWSKILTFICDGCWCCAACVTLTLSLSLSFSELQLTVKFYHVGHAFGASINTGPWIRIMSEKWFLSNQWTSGKWQNESEKLSSKSNWTVTDTFLVICVRDEETSDLDGEDGRRRHTRRRRRREKWNFSALDIVSSLTGTAPRESASKEREREKGTESEHQSTCFVTWNTNTSQWTLCITCAPAFHLLFLPFAFTGLSLSFFTNHTQLRVRCITSSSLFSS